MKILRQKQMIIQHVSNIPLFLYLINSILLFEGNINPVNAIEARDVALTDHDNDQLNIISHMAACHTDEISLNTDGGRCRNDENDSIINNIKKDVSDVYQNNAQLDEHFSIVEQPVPSTLSIGIVEKFLYLNG
jgi:hypothetical protein